MKKFFKIFGVEKPLIGVIHLPPTLSYKGFKGMNHIVSKALKDARALEKGGVNGIIVENEYDHPHTIFVNKAQVACLTVVTKEVVDNVNLPVGVCVLRNDYEAAFSIAKATGCRFIRLDVFVDEVKTNAGIIKVNPDNVMKFKTKIKCKNILLLTDIQVKHASLLKQKSIVESAKEAKIKGSDAVIVSGKRTGIPPSVAKVKKVKNAVGEFPVLVGSGVNPENIEKFVNHADGFIVGTYFKRNSYIDERKVKKLVDTLSKKTNNSFGEGY
ncbi:MAG TPA: BtpA/SgcQ family protein [Candidatus Aenigmarchaeota archaeon]|nr:BtpA/SgcQ family protein [Candidatus Aenigmarchaeota archaeon]